jgi:hypothetical protein
MPTKLKDILLKSASNIDNTESSLAEKYGFRENPVVKSPDKISDAVNRNEREKEKQDYLDKINRGDIDWNLEKNPFGSSIGKPKSSEKQTLANLPKAAPAERKFDDEVLKQNIRERIKKAYPTFSENDVEKYVKSYLPGEKKKYTDYLNSEVSKVKKELDPYVLTRTSNVQSELGEIESQRKGQNENLEMFRIGPKKDIQNSFVLGDKKFDYSQIYDVVNGKPQFNEKFLNEVARQRVLTNYQIPASQIAKDLIDNKINNYKYDFTEAQKRYNNWVDKNKDGVGGNLLLFTDQIGRKALTAFHQMARYAEGLAGETGIKIDGMPKSIMDAAEYSRKDKLSEKQIYNPEVQESFIAGLGGNIGTQIPMILGTIATGGGAALVEGELAASTAALGGIKSAVVGTAMRSGIAESAIGKFGLDATAQVLRGLNAGLKGAQKIGLGNVADNFITTFPTFFPTVHSSYYEELYNKGYRGKDLEEKVWQRALVSMATETIYNPFHNIGSIGKNNIVDAVLNASKKSWPQTLYKLGQASLKAGLPEGMEEVINKVADDWQDYNDLKSLNKNDISGFNFEKSVLSSGKDFALGSIAGLIMGGPSEALNLMYRPMQADALNYAMDNKEEYNKAIAESVAQKKITPEVAQTLKSFTNTLSPYYNTAKNMGLTGPAASQWAVEKARLNEAASLLQSGQADVIQSKKLTNIIGTANTNLKAIENGVFTGNALVGADEISRMVENQTPYGRLTKEQADAIASHGLYEVKTVPIVSNPSTIAPKNEDGSFDNTIPELAQQMRNKEVEIDNPNGLLPILDKNGRVIDGKKRIAAALALGQTEMNVMVPLSEDKITSLITDSLNTSMGTTLDPNKIKDLSPEDQLIVKSVSKDFDNYREIERLNAEKQDVSESDLKGTAFPIENVQQQLKPLYWAINELVSRGIPMQQVPSIVSAMTGSAVTPAMVDAVIKERNITPMDRPIASTVAPTVPGVAPAGGEQAPVLTAVNVADQIRELADKLDQGGLSTKEVKETKRQIAQLKRSDKISNFTKIVNELESKGIAQRLDKNCP